MSTYRSDPGLTALLTTVLGGLEAAGEITRLRLLALLAEAELTVSELVAILGQSQPRVSRHLKLLLEAGLVQRHREGAWAFFLLAEGTQPALLARDIVRHIDPADPTLAADRARLAGVRRARSDLAAAYFAAHAPNWDTIRSLHVAEETVEKAVLEEVGDGPLHALLDLGTGTGRMLELLAPLADRAVGVDQSPAMLNLARTRLERAGLRNIQLRQGDIYALPLEGAGYDLVIVHQVLHYLDDPGRAIREAARALRPGGRLFVIDFAPHAHEFLREEHAHRRLGFATLEIENYMREAGLETAAHRQLAPTRRAGDDLTVSVWVGKDPRMLYDAPLQRREFA
ncbi:MAG TPA: metalloregulator ArsR/SmtB family transcription factor [Beijerinckiaceae bacterium]|nr:metalloregulator ArsR/SmtB family transcription factor [Beijerinckiaceae bacterium]